jgi:hypothetical protein
MIEVQMGKLPIPFIVYGRWIAVAVLGLLITWAAARLRSDSALMGQIGPRLKDA